MEIIFIVIVIILAFIVVTLLLYNMKLGKKVENFNNLNQMINNLNVLQDFMRTIGEEDSSVDEKIRKINEILIEKYNIKYSTIVVFDGAEYLLKATNVDEKHWDTLRNLYNQEIFKDSIVTATPKYVTVEKESDRLPYQTMELGRAKSAMFFPLYIDNVYIGYWIIESGQMHAFDNIDTATIEIVRDNIITVLKTMEKQKTIENIVRTDKFTGLYSAEYLYGEAKKIIDKYTVSTVCMFSIINIEEINRKLSREIGNKVVIKVSKLVKDNISNEYIFVRYMGPKFVLVFSGVEPEGVVDFLNDLKASIEAIKVYEEDIEEDDTIEGNEPQKNKIYAKAKLNFVITSYYKGTGIDGVTKKLEEYIDEADKKESDINYI